MLEGTSKKEQVGFCLKVLFNCVHTEKEVVVKRCRSIMSVVDCWKSGAEEKKERKLRKIMKKIKKRKRGCAICTRLLISMFRAL